MKKKNHKPNRRSASGKTPGIHDPVAAVAAYDEKPALFVESDWTPRRTIEVELLSEMFFQQRVESFRSSLRRDDSIGDFIEVLDYAADHASQSKGDCARLPQWLLIRLSSLLEIVFLAPHRPGWFGRIRKRTRQHLLDLVRFQAVVNQRFEGHSVEDAYDLAGQALRRQGYEGGDEAIRWSYKRILKGLRDVEAAIGKSGIVDGQDREQVAADLAARKASVSNAASNAFKTLRIGAQLKKLGSAKARPEIEAPPNMELSLAEALLLPSKVLPGTEYLKRALSDKDALLADLVNVGDLGKAATAFAHEHPGDRGVIAFGLKPGTMCKVDAGNRPIEQGIFFIADRGLALAFGPPTQGRSTKG